jgi:hypothetical protein
VPNIPTLAHGTQVVLPTAYLRYQDGMNKVETVKVVRFSTMEVAIATIRASGRDSGGTANKAYITQLAFYEFKPNKTPDPLGNVGCRCGCPAYYFWFSEANRQSGAAYGARFKPYQRKTPITHGGYPPKNPSMVPGMCKHLLLLSATLQSSSYFIPPAINDPSLSAKLPAYGRGP